MPKRNPVLVFLLACFTCGIYPIVWYVTTKGQLNARGAEIPTAWLLIVPIVNLYWLWCFAQGVAKVTGGALNGVLAFLVLLVVPIGMPLVQMQLNKVE